MKTLTLVVLLLISMGLSTEQAELARKHGISRARINQWLFLLKLPRKEIRRKLAMGITGSGGC